jgi:hypothetical protein
MHPMDRRIVTLLSLLCAFFAVLSSAAAAEPAWAPASSATIRPGVQTVTEGSGQCTSNFVLYDSANVYLGQAAHCSGTGQATETNGCDAESLPLGTRVEVEGARRPGTLAYNSWLSMQQTGERDEEACAYNDFALVRLDPADARRVNPSIPRFGGPTGVGAASTGQQVYTYGNSSLRLGVRYLSPKNGVLLESSPGGWSHTVYTATPGIPGDSGSAFLNASGRALGTLSTLNILPTPGGNGVGDFGKELAYARAHGFAGLRLANGTQRFRPSILGLT